MDNLPNFTPVLFQYHTHAELAFNQNPDQIVYTEEAVNKILKDCIDCVFGIGMATGVKVIAPGRMMRLENLPEPIKESLRQDAYKKYTDIVGVLYNNQTNDARVSLMKEVDRLTKIDDDANESELKRLTMFKNVLKKYYG